MTTHPAPVAIGSSASYTPPDRTPRAVPRPAAWSLAHRVAFRFVCAYLVLYNLPFPLDLPPMGMIDGARVWAPLVRWTGAHVLRLADPITVMPNGSGDTTFNYVQVLCMAALSVVVAAVWSVADRRRPRYEGAHDLLRTYVRYALGFALWRYGAAKLLKTQFPDLDATMLAGTFGEASPMGLLWRFMGYSYAYNVYAGLAEMVPAALLFFRRTTTLGALLAAAAMSNVVMLNFTYDVPVKLYSTHLFLMALFLLAPALPRLVRGVALGGAVGAEPARRFLPGMPADWRRQMAALKALAVGVPTVGVLAFVAMRRPRVDPRANGTSAFTVERYERLATATARDSSAHWTRVERWGGQRARVRSAGGAVAFYTMSDDPLRRLYAFTSVGFRGLPDTAALLHYAHDDSGMVELTGRVGADSVRLRWRQVARDTLPLLRRGFHWVNEYPYHR